MPKEKISHSEYLQLVGLLTLTRRSIRRHRELAEAIREIVGETDHMGQAYDQAWDDNGDPDVLIKRLNITIEESETACLEANEATNKS